MDFGVIPKGSKNVSLTLSGVKRKKPIMPYLQYVLYHRLSEFKYRTTHSTIANPMNMVVLDGSSDKCLLE